MTSAQSTRPCSSSSMVSAATVGGELLSGQDTALWWSILRGVIRGVASWAAWALCTWALGEILFDVVETDADWGQLARTTGFAQIPGILNVLVFISTFGGIIYLVAYAWWLPYGRAWITHRPNARSS